MVLLEGFALSQKILSDLKTRINSTPNKPVLDIILVGNDPSSLKYVSLKQKRAKEIGIGGQIHRLPESVRFQEVVSLIQKLNCDPQITGLMVQLPLPSHLDTIKILNTIDPKKDADGLTATNLGLLFQNSPQAIASATALGIIKLLDHYRIPLCGKNAVIINRSSHIGLPLTALLLSRDCTVTICHHQTKNLYQICQTADILISAANQPNLITKQFIKPQACPATAGAVVVDIAGDVDFQKVAPLCSFITPTLGGVGPMTVASLLSNTVRIWKNQTLSPPCQRRG